MPRRDLLTLGLPPARDAATVRVRAASGAGPRPLRLVLRGTAFPGGDGWPSWVRPHAPVLLFAAPAPPEATPPPGQVIAEFLDGGRRLPAVTTDGGVVTFHFDPWAAADHMVHEGHVAPRRPLHTHLGGLAGWLPGRARLLAHRAAATVERLRHAGAAAFPAFPEDRAVEMLRLLVRRACGLPDPPGVWPAAPSALCLTHDVDTAEGQRAVERVAVVEERLGLRSCWYVVGCRFPLDHGLLTRLREAGHEIGLHGAVHDQKLAFLPPVEIERRLDLCQTAVERHRMAGFRSPGLMMSDALARAVGRRFEYDSSVPDTDIRSVAGPRRGCSSVFPFFRDDLLELPVTLPLDDRLLLLGLAPDAMVRLWQDKMAWIRQAGGLAVLATHAEPHLGASPRLIAAYTRLLAHVVEHRESMAPMLPREVAAVWRGG